MTLDPNEILDDLGAFYQELKEELNVSDEMIEYSKPAFKEHKKVILLLLSEGYAMGELIFRDYLSGEVWEISSEDEDLFKEARMDPRYDLIPCIIFWKPLENPTNLAETSAIWVEFHKMGNAF